ncbi:MAG TPA: hypothetical protein PLD25_30715 [Chloroflexota bacterium]|nr:hypothetical protein [Chloroflexota bacterium]
MDVEAITLALLKQTLEAWEKDEPVPAIWQSFVAWPSLRGLSPTALKIQLYDLWREIVWQQLNRQRQAEGLPSFVDRSSWNWHSGCIPGRSGGGMLTAGCRCCN